MSRPLNVLSLFAGIGGLELGLERAGMRVVGQVEIDPFCRKVLTKHWPEVPKHDDVRTAGDWWRSERRPRVDVVAGGFPCQPVSDAGLKMADQDERWLWPEMFAIVEQIRPTWVIGENVPGLLNRGLVTVRTDLERAGYAVRSGYISACAVGATHPRSRLFILAHTVSQGRCPWRPDRRGVGTSDGEFAHGGVASRGNWWTDEPRVDRVAYGVPDGLDRRRAVGNAVVPQVSEYIGGLITGSALAVAS